MKKTEEKKVKNIRITIDLPIKVPADWSNEEIEFYLNKSGYCCDNFIEGLRKYSKENGCICEITECRCI